MSVELTKGGGGYLGVRLTLVAVIVWRCGMLSTLPAKRSEFTDVQKLFLRLRTKLIITFRRVCFSCVKQQNMPATDEITS